ncbi:MAG: peroxiredoxin family protein [Chloroflexota bacterium]
MATAMNENEAGMAAELTGAALAAGSIAPPFALKTDPNASISLADLRGAPALVMFYPGDWTPVCNDQLIEVSRRLPEIAARGAKAVAISVDSEWSHAAFAEARGLAIPLLADFHPKGAVSKAWGVWSEEWGHSERALFLLDADGIVRWRTVVPPWVNPGLDEAFAALDALAAAAR